MVVHKYLMEDINDRELSSPPSYQAPSSANRRYQNSSDHQTSSSSNHIIELDPDLPLYLHRQVVNQPTEEGDPLMLHVFTFENKGLFEVDLELDFLGSEEIQIENAALGEL